MSAPIEGRVPATAAGTGAGRSARAVITLAWVAAGAVGALLFATSPDALAQTATVHTATAAPTSTIHYEEESFETFEGQLRGRLIAEAEFNKVAHHLHLTLRDARHVFVNYPGHEQPVIQSALVRAGIPVTIEYTPKAAKSSHHTLRYVAAGILVAVLIVLGVLLVARRRRLSRLEEHTGAGAQATPPSSE
jgi:hypothetical protein